MIYINAIIAGIAAIKQSKIYSKAKSKMRKFIVLCGPSHCGKSSYAKKAGANYAVISSDIIRNNLTGKTKLSEREDEVWRMFSKCKNEALIDRRNIILDACHITPQARWHALRGVGAEYQKICVLFNVKLKTIISRNGGQEWVKEMWQDFQDRRITKQKLLGEGFNKVKIAKG